MEKDEATERRQTAKKNAKINKNTDMSEKMSGEKRSLNIHLNTVNLRIIARTPSDYLKTTFAG